MEYKLYPPETKVRIKKTGQRGFAFESYLGYISVWIKNNDKNIYFAIDEVEFIEQV